MQPELWFADRLEADICFAAQTDVEEQGQNIDGQELLPEMAPALQI